jgi:hypothetical protein
MRSNVQQTNIPSKRRKLMEDDKKDLGTRILGLGEKAVTIMEEYFDGKRTGTDKVKEASSVLREAVKVRNRDKMDQQVTRSQAISLAKIIPKETRDKFLGMMIPEVKPFLLLARPEKIKK